MKKMLVLAALAAGLAAYAEDTAYQCLYWQVQADKVAENVPGYNVAYFYALDGDDVKHAIGVTDWAETQTSASRANSEIVGTADLSGYASGYSFLMELAYWDGSAGTTVGKSGTFAFSDLSAYMTSVPGGSGIPTQGVFAPTFTVPEPTSGLLMLLGLAGLALRRKRA